MSQPKGQFINLTAADGTQVPAYVAQPVAPAKGAIVVVQEIFGVNAHIRAVADGYAADGYLAVAPAIFQRVKPGVELGYSEADMNQGFAYMTAVAALPAPGVMQDIQAAIDHAAKVSGGKVGIVGFCWGGLLTWRAACTLKGLAAAVTYYGGGMTTADEVARKPLVPVLAHFGDLLVQELVQLLQRRIGVANGENPEDAPLLQQVGEYLNLRGGLLLPHEAFVEPGAAARAQNVGQ